MTPSRCAYAPSRRGPGSPSALTHPISPNLSLEPRAGRGQRVHGDVLIHMYGLGVLSQIVQAGETPGAVTLEWAFTSVFSDLEC